MTQETLEEVSERYANMQEDVSETIGKYLVKAVFKDGAYWNQERSYSEEEMREAFNNGAWRWRMHSKVDIFKEWLEQFKKK